LDGFVGLVLVLVCYAATQLAIQLQQERSSLWNLIFVLWFVIPHIAGK